jgi:hypothetical protein
VRLFVSPPPGAATWTVLRRASDTITGPNDAGAIVAAPWGRFEAVIDTDGLVNGTPAYYAVFYRDAAGAPLADPRARTRSVTPAATARDTSTDYMPLIRGRMQIALDNAVADGRLSHHRGRIPIVTAPSLKRDEMPLPIVSVHLDSDRPAERAVGDHLLDLELAEAGWDESEGWLSEVSLNVVGVCLNPDQRNALGRVLKHAILANRDIWHAHGIMRPAVNLTHTEMQPEASNAPLYIVAATFTFIVTSATTAARGEVEDAIATVNVIPEESRP